MGAAAKNNRRISCKQAVSGSAASAGVDNSGENDIIKSGVVSEALKPDSDEAQKSLRRKVLVKILHTELPKRFIL